MGGDMMPKITVFSTVAKDIFLNESGDILMKRVGGPATFIKQTLNELKIEYEINLSNEMTVEILLTRSGEYGRIKDPPQRKKIQPPSTFNILLISTILDEWILPLEFSNIFLDIQGYVRDGEKFGAMKPFNICPKLENNLLCLKAEKDEVNYLEKSFIERQKMKQLVITKGEDGLDLYVEGNFFEIKNKAIKDLPDTVGAGDTWFSAYLAYQTKGFSCFDSATMAIDYVRKFLKEKKKEKYENKKKTTTWSNGFSS